MRLGYFNPNEKLFYHADRVAQFARGDKIYPVMIEWFLAGMCNLKCDFCSFAKSHNNTMFNVDHALKLIPELKNLGVKAINFTGGGEPTLHIHYSKIAQQAYNHGLDIGLFTNGVKMKAEFMKLILRTHKWVRFSIDAGTEETFLKTKGVDKYRQVMDNLRFMMMLKHNFSSATDVGAGFVITKRNYKEIELFANQCLHLGVDYVQFKPQIHPYFDNEQEDKDFWTENIRPLLERVSKDSRVMVNLYKLRDLEDGTDRPYTTCYGWKFCPCIASDGHLYICNYLAYMPKHSLGNLYVNKFTDIWKDRDMKICKECQSLCKNDAINKILFKIKDNQSEHKNFL